MANPRAPAVFFGHGSPMNALGGPFADAWRALGERIGKLRGVVMVSAHWQGDGAAVTAQARPQTIHDFGAFPPALHAIQYPAPGDPDLARRIAGLLAPTPVDQASDWGLDHGAWSVLMHVFPKADVPIVQLRLDQRLNAREHYELGRRLAVLRDEGVMIAASGDVVHNLRAVQWQGGPAYDWAQRFNSRVRAAIENGDHDSIIAMGGADEEARLSIPTDEHWTPLFYALGAATPGETPEIFTDQMDLGSISMMGVGFGIPDRQP